MSPGLERLTDHAIGVAQNALRCRAVSVGAPELRIRPRTRMTSPARRNSLNWAFRQMWSRRRHMVLFVGKLCVQ